MLAVSPLSLASTTCPPVTFENEELDNNVGKNWDEFVKADAGYVPFKTWYVSNAAVPVGSVAAAAPALELRKAAIASLLGARMVMLLAWESAPTKAGSAPNRARGCQVQCKPLKQLGRTVE